MCVGAIGCATKGEIENGTRSAMHISFLLLLLNADPEKGYNTDTDKPSPALRQVRQALVRLKRNGHQQIIKY